MSLVKPVNHPTLEMKHLSNKFTKKLTFDTLIPSLLIGTGEIYGNIEYLFSI